MEKHLMQASWFWNRTHRLKILPKPSIESYTKGHSKIDSKKKTTRSGRIRHYWKALRNKPQKLYSSVSRTMCWSFSAQHWISKYKNILVIGILQAGKLHEFGVWIKRPLRKKNTAHAHSLLSCPSTSLEILLSKQHVLLPAFDLIVL